MATDKDLPAYLDSSFLRGLTQSRITRRAALAGAGTVSLAAFLAACGIGGQQAATHANWVWDKAKKAGQLDFANWPLYIDVADGPNGTTKYPSLEKFTADTSIKVTYSEPISDLAEFFAKIAPTLQAGQPTGYDIIVITNGIEMTNLQLKHWLTELDPSQLGNFFKYASPRLLSRSFDPGNKFTIPWQSGFTGIGYNPKKTGRDITSFNDLFDPAFKGKVGMFTNNEETGNFTMVGMGIKPETSKPSDWQKAADKLKQQRDSGILRKFYDQSYIHALSTGDVWLTMAWSGDVFQANLSAGNEDLKFILPTEGGLIWTDNMCIPLNAAHPVDAITYMNYVYQPEIAAMLAEYIDYITPVPSAKQVVEQQAAAATDKDTKASLEGTANSQLVFPTQAEFSKTSYYRTLTPSETAQWNSTFDAVILT
jgi:spermidine/putrescine transport system substrate-binding protein